VRFRQLEASASSEPELGDCFCASPDDSDGRFLRRRPPRLPLRRRLGSLVPPDPSFDAASPCCPPGAALDAASACCPPAGASGAAAGALSPDDDSLASAPEGGVLPRFRLELREPPRLRFRLGGDSDAFGSRFAAAAARVGSRFGAACSPPPPSPPPLPSPLLGAGRLGRLEELPRRGAVSRERLCPGGRSDSPLRRTPSRRLSTARARWEPRSPWMVAG
jgi:hypothetical protein